MPHRYQNNPNKIFVERKSANDACSSFTNGYDRFCRELDRIVKDDSYLVIIIESSYSNLMSFNNWDIYKKSKINSSYLFHQIREINEKYPLHCQFVCMDSHTKTARLVEKLFLLHNNIRNIDIQYLLDIGNLSVN